MLQTVHCHFKIRLNGQSLKSITNNINGSVGF